MKKEQTIHVLVVVCQLNRGGLESRLMDIIRKIDFKRVKMDIFTLRLDKGLFDEEAIQLGCDIYYNPALTIRNMTWYVHYFKRFLLKHPKYQVVHVHQDAWCSVFCKGASLAGVKTRIAHSRTAIITKSLKNIIKDVIKIPTRKYATHYFAVSQKAGEWLYGKRLVARGRVEIWKNAIDCDAMRYNSLIRVRKRQELGVTNDYVIMHVGNFTPPKNHGFIIDVFERLHKKNQDAKLVLVGKDSNIEPCMQRIKDKVVEKGLENSVLFLGMRTDISELLQAADVFLFPSIYEGLPGAVIEAQAAGLTCVISDSISSEVVVLPETKMISLQDDMDIWVESLIQAKENVRRDRYDELCASGYDVNSLVEQLMNFYENVNG